MTCIGDTRGGPAPPLCTPANYTNTQTACRITGYRVLGTSYTSAMRLAASLSFSRLFSMVQLCGQHTSVYVSTRQHTSTRRLAASHSFSCLCSSVLCTCVVSTGVVYRSATASTHTSTLSFSWKQFKLCKHVCMIYIYRDSSPNPHSTQRLYNYEASKRHAPELLCALRPPIFLSPFHSDLLRVSLFSSFFFVRHTLCGACLDERCHNLLVPVTFCKPQRAAAVGIE